MAVRIVVNGKGILELLKSPGIQADLRARAAGIASRAGPGMEVRPSEVGGRRARVAVITGTREARIAQGRNKTLTRAIGGAR